MLKAKTQSALLANKTDKIITNLSIDGMNCASCVRHVESAIKKLNNIDDVKVNLATKIATIQSKQHVNMQEIKQAIEHAGYKIIHKTVDFDITGMNCASCQHHVAKAFQAVAGVEDVSINLATNRAHISYIGADDIIHAMVKSVATAGYIATPILQTLSSSNQPQAEAQTIWRSFIFALTLTLPVFLIEMGGHLIPSLHHWLQINFGELPLRLLQFALTSLVIFGPGLKFFKSGIPALWRATTNMNSLVSIGSFTAWAYSTFATFAGHILPQGANQVYFEAAAVIITLILLGRWLEAGARGRTSQALRLLADMKPQRARIQINGQDKDVAIETIAVGDIIIIRPGEKLPVDGTIIHGASHIDQSMMTGEPMSVAKNIGDAVFAGTINAEGSFSYRAEKIGADMLISQIQKMVADAQSSKLPIQTIVDKIIILFVPAIFAVALLTFCIWLMFAGTQSLAQAIIAAVSVLIIACPCAMGLATPTSIMVATGRGARLGILFRKGDALQQLSSVKLVAFDKTGTLTAGKPQLSHFETAVEFTEDEVLPLIASLEAKSEHPIAKAIVDAAKQNNQPFFSVDQFAAHSGYGLSGVIQGNMVTIGNSAYMAKINANIEHFMHFAKTHTETGKTVFYAAIDSKAAAVFAVSDPIKPEAAKTIQALHTLHITSAMITGDNRAAAQVIAHKLDIKQVEAELLPDGKLSVIKQLQKANGNVAFVGDGINDAPALATANIGIAIGTGSDVAIESADVVLMSGDTQGVINAILLSRATLKNIKENLFWAFAYNIALIPIAAGILYPFWGILLSPMLAAGAMTLSSIFVLTNALRLKNFKPLR